MRSSAFRLRCPRRFPWALSSVEMKGAIFDLDGLIIDTEPIYIVAEQKIIDKYSPIGGDVRALTPQLLGTSAIDSARLVISTFKMNLSEKQYLHERDKVLRQQLHRATILPGVKQISDHFIGTGVRQAIATSSSRETCRWKLETDPDFFSRFSQQVVVCQDDVSSGKPAPDIFQCAMKRMGRERVGDDPSKICVFEDAPAGVLGAKRAGMKCVAVRNPHTPLQAYHLADVVINSLEEFRPESVGFAPYPPHK